MKKYALITLTLIVTFAYSQTNVTFRANTSLLHGVVDSTSGIDLRGTVTQWAAGTNLTNVGGDYWEITLQLAPGDYEYKYGGQVKNQDGTISDYWENDLPGAIGGAGNRTLTVGNDDMILDMDYVGDDYSGHPYFTPTDNIDVLFRVNMSEDPDFTVGQDTVSIVGGFDSIIDGTGTGLNGMWSPGTFEFQQEGTSSYYYYHMQLSEPTDVHGDAFGAGIGQIMYRFAKGTIGSWGASENLNGAYVEGNENRLIRITADTTVQWFYWNDKGPAPFEASDSLASLTFTTDVSAAITADGFDQGDTLLVKWGYGGTQQSVRTDTLVAGFGTVYSVTIPDVGVDLESDGMFYQYYHFKNNVEDREIYFDFEYEGDDRTLAERRLHNLEGATDGSDFTILDTEVSNVTSRRMPLFPNTNLICPGCPDDHAIQWTYVVDLRPAYYQVLAGSTLEDIQGDIDISSVEQIDELGVYMNGPATVDQIQTESWTTWGGTLAQTEYKKMHDDGMSDFDEVAGDTLYSNTYIYQSNSTRLNQVFKFGIGGGDNETGYGNNHRENLDPSLSSTKIYAVFGSIDPDLYNAWDYDTNKPTLEVKLTGGALPHQFSLSDNYPNPFNPTTTIEFKLPIGTDVTLTIYNLLGEKVATIYNSYAQPGNYQATWNGLDSQGNQVPTGTYLIELTAENHFQKVKKMTFMK